MPYQKYLDHSYKISGRLINPISGIVSFQDKSVHIRRKELELLAILIAAKGVMVTRDEFIKELWLGNEIVGDAGLTRTVASLRKAIFDVDKDSQLIRTIPRKGYQVSVQAQLVNDKQAYLFSAGKVIDQKWQLIELDSKNSIYEDWIVLDLTTETKRVLRVCCDEQRLSLLKNEAQTLQFSQEVFAGSTQITPIYDWQLDEPPHYLILNHVNTPNLLDWSYRENNLANKSYQQRLEILGQIAVLIEEIHDNKIIHNNINPRSLLVKESGGLIKIQISDFGFSHITEEQALIDANISFSGFDVTASGQLHHAMYLSPERLHKNTQSTKNDVYAFGVLIYQMLVGNFHFAPSGGWGKKLTHKQLRELIASCISNNSEERPSFKTIVKHLETIASSANLNDLFTLASPTHHTEKYQVLEQLGVGGMGTVYLAQQQEPIKRLVAIKKINSRLDDSNMLLRFEAEQQVLALMNHPNVAAVYEAGVNESKEPYIVMEYIKGYALDIFCDQNKLSLIDRVKLIQQVCDGLGHAHKKGVVHRDINPLNLLVKGSAAVEASVKIIDFGVAKSCNQELFNQNLKTQLGSFVGTPRYVSPEQLKNTEENLDIRSDIYSIGVVLYELVTGFSPYPINDESDINAFELGLLVTQNNILDPYQKLMAQSETQLRAIAHERSTSITRLKKNIKPDLSWIILKCLELNPDDRYDSCKELKNDLSNWLENRPVEARKAKHLYKFNKFVKRNKVLAAMVALFFITLSVLGAFAFNEYKNAKINLRDFETISDYQKEQLRLIDPKLLSAALEKQFQAAVNDKSDLTAEQLSQQQKLLSDINFMDISLKQIDEVFYQASTESIEKKYTDLPHIQLKLIETLADSAVEIRFDQRAQTLRTKTVELSTLVYGAQSSQTAIQKYKLAQVTLMLGENTAAKELLLESMGQLTKDYGLENTHTLTAIDLLGLVELRLNNLKVAGEYLHKAYEGRVKMFGEDSPELLTSLENLAKHSFLTGGYETTKDLLQDIITINEAHYGSEDLVTLTAIMRLGVMHKILNEFELGLPYVQKSYTLLERVYGKNNPSTIEAMSHLANCLQYLGEFDEAFALQTEAVNIAKEIYGQEHPITNDFMLDLSIYEVDFGNYEKALELLKPAQEFFYHTEGRFGFQTFNSSILIADIVGLRGDLEQSIDLLKQILVDQIQTYGPNHVAPLGLKGLLADKLSLIGAYEEAEKLMLEVLEQRVKQEGEQSKNTFNAKLNLAKLYMNTDKLKASEALYDELLNVFNELSYSTELMLGDLNHSYVGLLIKLEKYELAHTIQQQVFEFKKNTFGSNHVNTAEAESQLGYIELMTGEFSAAEKSLMNAVSIQQETLGWDNPITLQTRFSLLKLKQRSDETEFENKQVSSDSLSSLLEVAAEIYLPTHPFIERINEQQLNSINLH